MTEPRNTLLPPHLRVNDRRQAERIAAIEAPRFPATGTARISALLAAAREKEQQDRRAAARVAISRSAPTDHRPPAASPQ